MLRLRDIFKIAKGKGIQSMFIMDTVMLGKAQLYCVQTDLAITYSGTNTTLIVNNDVSISRAQVSINANNILSLWNYTETPEYKEAIGTALGNELSGIARDKGGMALVKKALADQMSIRLEGSVSLGSGAWETKNWPHVMGWLNSAWQTSGTGVVSALKKFAKTKTGGRLIKSGLNLATGGISDILWEAADALGFSPKQMIDNSPTVQIEEIE